MERLQSVINKLKAENVEYRNNSKTDQFEARIQELEKKLQNTGAQKVTPLPTIAPAGLHLPTQFDLHNLLQLCSFCKSVLHTETKLICPAAADKRL